MDFAIEEMRPADWSQVSAIYLAGVKTGIATFRNNVPTWEEWNRDNIAGCRLAACSADMVLGWAALTKNFE